MPRNGSAGVVRDTSHVWLVHSVGLADLGVRGERDACNGQARLSELQETVAGGDLDRLWNLVWHERYESKAALPAASSGQYRDLPLPKLLRGLARPGTGVTRVRVLLVAATSEGNRSDGLRVADLCRCLCDAVTALRPAIHGETGFAFEIVDVEGAFPAGLEESNVLGALVERHEALRAAVPGRVMIGWGSGATSTPFGIASAAVRLGLPWHLLDYTTPDPSGGQAAAEVDPLEAVDDTWPPAVPYLTRLRLFHELAGLASARQDDPPEVQLTAGQERAVQSMVDLVDRGYRATNTEALRANAEAQRADAEALRQVAWEAIVRRDGTAGFALRRYVIARYHALCGSLGVKRAETFQERKDRERGRFYVPKLGELHELAKELSDTDPTHRPNAWLASQQIQDINEFGSAAHDLRLSAPTKADEIARWLVQWDGLSVAEADLVAQLGVRPASSPASGLLAVWAVGTHADDGRASVAHHLRHEGPGAAVEQFLGADGSDGSQRFPLRALLLATSASRSSAERQREELIPIESRDVTATVQLVGPEFRDRVLVRSQIQVYLSEILDREGDAIGGLLLVPTGPKPIVLAAVQALFRVSAERAIPFFVRDLAAEEKPFGDLHLWPASVGHDRPLFTTALGAFDRLELDAAARLLGGTSRAEDLAVECEALARDFTGRGEDWQTWQRPAAATPPGHWVHRGRLAQRLELVAHCASSLAGASGQGQAGRDPNALLTRCLVLAGTLVENWEPLLFPADDDPKRKKKWRLLERVAPTDAKKKSFTDPARGHAAVLLTLRTARNKIPITHAQASDAEHAVEAAIHGLKYDQRPWPAPWPASRTPLAFLQAAPLAAVPWDLPAAAGPPLLERYADLRSRIVQSGSEAAR